MQTKLETLSYIILTHVVTIGPPIINLTFTLYCTIIPRFSRCDGSAIL